MNGKIEIKLKDIDNEGSVVAIHSEIDEASAEEAIAVVFGLADAMGLTKNPEYAGVLAMCIMANKPPYDLVDEMGGYNMAPMGEAIHEGVNELIDEYRQKYKSRNKHSDKIKAMLDEIFGK